MLYVRVAMSIDPGQQSANVTTARIPYLDGLRGLAILLVVFGHYFPETYPAGIGWSGLNLFFILSGYLITSRLYAIPPDNVQSGLLRFYWSRFLRIFPLYYAILIIFFLVLPLAFSKYQAYFHSIYDRQAWYWTYTTNFMIILKGLPAHPVFFHFWSLAVEEQFYLAWPFFFILFMRLKKIWVIIGLLLILSIVFRNTGKDYLASYINTGTAIEPFMLGALVYLLQERGLLERWFRTASFITIAAAVTLMSVLLHDHRLRVDNEWLLRIGYSCIDLVWSFLLLLLILGKFNARYWVQAPWLQWLGRYSYGIYLFHYIILNLLVYKTDHDMTVHGWSPLVAYLTSRFAGVALTLTISLASFHLYEKKFLRLKMAR